VQRRFASLEQLAKRLGTLEERHRVPRTRAPEPGFAAAAWAWAEGRGLEGILDEDLTGGDFVRNVRQLVDLLRQLAEVAPEPATRRAADVAADALLRGVVVSSGGPE